MVVELDVVDGHDGLDTGPLWRAGRDAEAVVRGGSCHEGVHEAETLCGRECRDVEGEGLGGRRQCSGRDAMDEIRVAANE
jgi:hypothetical protein